MPATLFRHAVFVPPGYTSLLFAQLDADADCRARTPLFAGFRRFMLRPFGLLRRELREARRRRGPSPLRVRVTLGD
jgi:hypothetical protein